MVSSKRNALAADNMSDESAPDSHREKHLGEVRKVLLSWGFGVALADSRAEQLVALSERRVPERDVLPWLRREAKKVAIGALYGEHVDMVRRLLSRLRVPSEEVEDGANEVFLRLVRRANEDRPPVEAAAVRAFIQGVARHVARERGNKARREVTLSDEDLEMLAGTAPSALDVLVAKRIEEWLCSCLPQDELEVFVLHDHGLPPREIANVLGCSREEVNGKLAAAKRRLVDAYNLLMKRCRQ